MRRQKIFLYLFCTFFSYTQVSRFVILLLQSSLAFQCSSSSLRLSDPTHPPTAQTNQPPHHFSTHQATCPCTTKATLEEIWESTISAPQLVLLGPRCLELPMSTRENLGRLVGRNGVGDVGLVGGKCIWLINFFASPPPFPSPLSQSE